MNLRIENARGQCYIGASVMAVAKSGMASRIKSLNRKCLYTHCYGHALNLCVKDACNKVTCLKNTMDAAWEICKLVKRSPQRESHLKKIRIEGSTRINSWVNLKKPY